MKVRLAVAAAAAGSALLAGCAALPSGSAAEPPPVDPPVRPMNVVLVLTDDQTTGSLAKMPYLSSQRWVRFRQAFVENGLCCPSRATVLQGRYDTHTQVQNNAQAERFDASQTLAVWLQQAGYRTGLFGKYLNGYAGGPVPQGWDDWQVPYSTAALRQYEYPMSSNGTVEQRGSTTKDYQVNLLAERSARFIADSARDGQPFFAMFTPTSTHSPWRASPNRTGWHAGAPVPRTPAFNEADVSDKPAFIRKRALVDPAVQDGNQRKEWDGALSVDDALLRLDGALQAAGVYEDTVVIYMSDNGYAFGRHRWVTKRCQYDECSRVPLLVRYPGQAARTDDHLVSNTDIASTVLDVAGAVPGVAQDGTSLLPLIAPADAAAPPWRSSVLMHSTGGDADGVSGRPDSMPQFWGVRTERDKYVELDTGEREYYDLVADPHELVNRVGSVQHASRVEELRAELLRLKATADAESVPSNPSWSVPGDPGPDVD